MSTLCIPSCWYRALLFAVAACALPATAAAQGEPERETEAPRNYFIPVPVVYYTPETKLALGISGAYIYRTGEATVDSRPSTLGGVAIYTFRNQLLTSLGGVHYFDHDRQQLEGGLAYRNFPNEFYGLGNDTDADFSQDYTDEGAGFALDYLREVVPGLRLGGGLSAGTSSITETEAGDLLDGDAIPGSQGGQVLGLGLSANYDTRANISFPRGGAFHQLSWRIYEDVLGADYALTTTTVDLRQYVPLGGAILALRALGTGTTGTVPFQLMPELGGDLLLRGYFGGRFRDRQRVAAQAELRVGSWHRIGAAVFGGMGQVAPELDQLGIDRFHYSYGAGLRILLIKQEQMNLRADFGFGEDQSGFYFGFGEVF